MKIRFYRNLLFVCCCFLLIDISNEFCYYILKNSFKIINLQYSVYSINNFITSLFMASNSVFSFFYLGSTGRFKFCAFIFKKNTLEKVKLHWYGIFLTGIIDSRLSTLQEAILPPVIN